MTAEQDRELFERLGHIEANTETLVKGFEAFETRCRESRREIYDRLGKLERGRAANCARASERWQWMQAAARLAAYVLIGLGGLAWLIRQLAGLMETS